tara:strand:- start:325 stop:459 length:135 start_codon:yes stop_codon:yes gene_type:complete
MKLTTVKQRQNIVIAYTVANTKETYIFNTTEEAEKKYYKLIKRI